ncbi:hypothetical protein EIL87_04825 [Saccharopolyspora rhizosphaerae]|uniref:Uncharacterized protein n=1 Tax=Saccharopolyspora rhizosphaerae TaxID=2492662 RepID=A0A426K2C4_9PSEU|nr:hypothetical protein [Saccharopolyspora rhizosphaerae]RRO19423.1 hypothetical protein EIL87_04825 [Saccharopolyspora rhizosphaerae]
MELLVLMFVCGLAVATLVFVPLLHRAKRMAAQSQQTGPRGRHAAVPGASPAKIGPRSAKTGSEPEAKADSEKTETEGENDGEATQPVKVEVIAPRPQIEPMPMPELPTDIFEARYQAKFNRSKRRLERIRSELSKTG